MEPINKQEKFFKFDSGKIFKRELNTGLFYLLNENLEWVHTPSLMNQFFDASSNYEEINEESINSILEGNGKTR